MENSPTYIQNLEELNSSIRLQTVSEYGANPHPSPPRGITCSELGYIFWTLQVLNLFLTNTQRKTFHLFRNFNLPNETQPNYKFTTTTSAVKLYLFRQPPMNSTSAVICQSINRLHGDYPLKLVR